MKTEVLDGAIARIAIEEAAVAFAFGVVTVGVELHAVGEIVAGVVEQGGAVTVRNTPGLHHGAFDGGIRDARGEACGEGSCAFSASSRSATEDPIVVARIGVVELAAGVVTPPALAVLDSALRELLVEPVAGDGDEAAVAEGQTDVALDAVLRTVAFEVLTGVIDEADAFAVFLEVEVDHPGDGVRPVLGGSAVPQHFNASDCRGGDGGKVRALGTGTADLHQGGAVTTLTVHEHQGVVRGQTAKGCRTDEGRPVADRLPRHVVGRHQRLHEVVHVGVGRPFNGFCVKHVHRNGGIRCGPRLTTETGDHHLFDGLFGQRDGRHGEGSACRCNRNR